MNSIITIEPFANFPRVNYYTLKCEWKDKTETQEFIERYESVAETKQDFEEIFLYLNRWGRKGLRSTHLLREEQQAHALPPRGLGINKLRLYCIPIRENLIILGNGGQKAPGKNAHQDSPDLKPKFTLINKVSLAINRMLLEKHLFVKGNTLEGDLEIWLD